MTHLHELQLVKEMLDRRDVALLVTWKLVTGQHQPICRFERAHEKPRRTVKEMCRTCLVVVPREHDVRLLHSLAAGAQHGARRAAVCVEDERRVVWGHRL